MNENVTLEQLESLIAHDDSETNDDREAGLNLSFLTADTFGIAGSLGGEDGSHEPSALKKLLIAYDKDGHITKDDIKNFLNELGSFPSREEIQKKINSVDKNENGVLNLNQFLHLLQNELQIKDTEEEVIESFKLFDRDGDGTMTVPQLRHVMTHLGDKLSDDEVDQMIRMTDSKGTGIVNYTEFVQNMMKNIEHFEKVSKY